MIVVGRLWVELWENLVIRWLAWDTEEIRKVGEGEGHAIESSTEIQDLAMLNLGPFR